MNGFLATYGSLGLAVICEVIGTSALKESEQFTRLVPTLVMAGSYLCAFYLLSIAIRAIPIGIAYAIWSGLGIVLISAVGLLVFKQELDLLACIGLGLILVGVAVVNLFFQNHGALIFTASWASRGSQNRKIVSAARTYPGCGKIRKRECLTQQAVFAAEHNVLHIQLNLWYGHCNHRFPGRFTSPCRNKEGAL